MSAAKHTPTRRSYLVACTGKTRGVLASLFARDSGEAERAVSAAFLDTFEEDGAATVIDDDATPNLWIAGDPAYILAAIARATAQQPDPTR